MTTATRRGQAPGGARRAATLFAIPGSHAVRTGELMLEHKGIPFRRVNFPPGAHRALVRLMGFRGDRVPAVKFADGRRAQGTRELPRVLDELVPEPRLVPDDPRALEAEAWADDVLQQWARRMVATAGSRDPDELAGRGAGGRLGALLTRRERPRRVVARAVLVAFGVTKDQQRDDAERTGAILDRVDAWIEEGVLNGEELRSPDLAVASSLALVEYIVALQPELRRRPAMKLLDRVFSGSAAARGPG
jgi:glutathione S-transferase